MNCRKLRYQSNEMGGRPVSGILTAASQKPLRASPVWTQAGLEILCWAASNHCRPSQMRGRTKSQPANGWLSSFWTSGGSWTISPLRVVTVVFMGISCDANGPYGQLVTVSVFSRSFGLAALSGVQAAGNSDNLHLFRM